MKRMFMFFVLVFCVFASVYAQAVVFSDENYPDFIFIRKNGAAVITGYTGTVSDLVIPDRLRGWPVQVIGDRAFAEKGITSVTIPFSVGTIERFAFAGNPLATATFPYNAYLGRRAFPSDTQLLLIQRPVPPVTDASDKLDFGIAVNPGGFLLSGPSLLFDFTKGSFNSEIELVFPSLDLISGASPVGGFGGLATFNYIWNSPIGELYLGGGLGYIWLKYGAYSNHLFTAGLNAGYRYETSLGIYFKVGSFVGAKYANKEFGVHVMPTLSTGYSF